MNDWMDGTRTRGFFMPRSRGAVDGLERKRGPEAFEMCGLGAFQEQYPKGKNYVVSPLNGRRMSGCRPV